MAIGALANEKLACEGFFFVWLARKELTNSRVNEQCKVVLAGRNADLSKQMLKDLWSSKVQERKFTIRVSLPHHVNPLEMVEAAVGVVDAAWTAVERHRDHAHHDVAAATWEDCVKLEGELIQERSENHRLKVALEELRKALHALKKRDCNRQSNAIPASFNTFKDGYPADLHERLLKKVDTPAFLERLKDMQEVDSQKSSRVALKDAEKSLEMEDCSSWVVVPNKLLETDGREEISALEDEGFLLISQDDVIESLAAFVAKLVVSNPNAKSMSPLQIQEVISVAFAKLEQKGKLRKLWSTAKFVYSSVTWTTTIATTAVGLYKNPFIVRALFKALTMSSRLVIKALA
ncbi:hypothetical protein GOP47_0004328 [Adiantum capillus-veneris]|uniref:Uncharacterized protein n=1 Tax=Adiantum capillus-veneris TaxID=13818 RepID=A0A9D4ZQ93_ADICA|nr:hypothetical protein GOP47_0004328 [Adiantum capillus-veneris]